MASPLHHILMANQKQKPKNQKQEPILPNNIPRKAMNKPATTRKKIPQRGMGVAQLERLRLDQERLKTLQENTNNPNTNLDHHSFSIQESSKLQPFNTVKTLPSDHPIQSCPVQYYYGNTNNSTTNVPFGGGLGFDNHGHLVIKRIENVGHIPCVFGGGFDGSKVLVGNSVHGGGDGVRGRGYVGGSEIASGSVYENSKQELSSIPKIFQHYNPHENSSLPSDFWFKKKRFNGEIGNTERTVPKRPEITPMNVSQFIGTNPELDLNDQQNGFIARAARSAYYANYTNLPTDQSREAVGIRRKGKGNGGNMFMEYDFFPGKRNSCCSDFKKKEIPDKINSCLTNSDNNNDYYYYYTSSSSNASSTTDNYNYNSIDLSLKL